MNVTVTDVLGALFNPTDTVCFRVFEDKKTGVFRGAKLSCECGKYKSIEETLKNHNAMQRGIFFVVNYGGQDDAAITRWTMAPLKNSRKRSMPFPCRPPW